MNTLALTFVVFLVFSFFFMYLIQTKAAKKYVRTQKINVWELPIVYIGLFYVLGSIGSLYLFENADFVEPLTLARVIVPIIMAVFLYGLAVWRDDWVLIVALMACLTVNTLMQPQSMGAWLPKLPFGVVIIMVVALGTLYCHFYKIMNNSLSAVAVSQMITIGGLCFLSYFGALPVYTALVSAMMLGAIAAYLSVNYNDEKLPLDNASCLVLAYLVWNLLLLQLGEFCFSSCLILTAIFWAELVMAVWGKFINPGVGTLRENTAYYQMEQNYSTKAMVLNMLRTGVVAYFIAWFQLHSANQYSLFVLTFLIVMWLNYTALYPERKAKKLKEVNREFVAGIKDNIQEAKDVWKKVQNNDDKDN